MEKNEAARALGKLSAAKRKAEGFDYKKLVEKRWKKHREKKTKQDQLGKVV